jgi:7-cyano-7-deazaguanine reductase
MTKCGDYADKALVKLKVLAEKDLSELLETKVVIGIFQATNIGFIVPPITNWLTEYEDWENIDYANDGFEYNEYKENPELLQIEENPKGIIVAQAFVTTVLRSNCPVTGAPDAGDAYIYIKGVNPIDKESLLRYIVSFREHKEFHENCVERIYTRLWNKFTPDELFVYCAYVRRGSLDINPLRVSHVDLIPEQLISITSPFVKTLRQ